MNISSVTCARARTRSRPGRRPGRCRSCCPGAARRSPAVVTDGSNGLPHGEERAALGTSGRPARRCTPTCEVGLDSANTIGRSLSRAIALSTVSVNAPPTAATPMMRGRLERRDRRRAESRPARARARSGSLCSARSVAALDDQALASRTSQQRRRAVASSGPRATIAATIRSAMPVAASPAPRNSSRCSAELPAGDAQRREQRPPAPPRRCPGCRR